MLLFHQILFNINKVKKLQKNVQIPRPFGELKQLFTCFMRMFTAMMMSVMVTVAVFGMFVFVRMMVMAGSFAAIFV